ncbi:MAG TPA: hypothetical protein PKC31_03315 [Candidatus Nanoperiomorbaceae bacterium]|jgi:predicted membrane channel-forming protein YqfA (hemolysin III family)|nr:MAG: hypothetical protein IPL44_03235 [Candidatus Saccharibacteria bacterium]HMQ09443.1 hypothetical protein [Candidatus Nanoperiomorbaceae bacterium]HMQ96848.1 hypothetical protein [Candidatus Nanoperiomorbaceae bacterium]HMR86455.1 hypothetical protein [Candidatus Nanoperiomorbaceae bacterium]HMU12030.1 hypothetical protein [Candidatus Nanoperiomorbaceae bacterium]
MKLEYIFVVIGGLLATWAQIFLRDDMWGWRVILTIIGIAIAGSAFDIAKKSKKGDK